MTKIIAILIICLFVWSPTYAGSSNDKEKEIEINTEKMRKGVKKTAERVGEELKKAVDETGKALEKAGKKIKEHVSIEKSD